MHAQMKLNKRTPKKKKKLQLKASQENICVAVSFLIKLKAESLQLS